MLVFPALPDAHLEVAVTAGHGLAAEERAFGACCFAGKLRSSAGLAWRDTEPRRLTLRRAPP
jgi:hypothetical protein